MAIKDIVTRGYGPSAVGFVPTRGYTAGALVAALTALWLRRRRRQKDEHE